MATFKTSDRNDQTDRLLDDTQLDAIVGGALDNCIPVRTVTATLPTVGWTFKDQFAKPTLGTYH
jgi:hypothetical protein